MIDFSQVERVKIRFRFLTYKTPKKSTKRPQPLGANRRAPTGRGDGIRRWQILQGSFSAVSKSSFATKYSLESSRRDLHNTLLCTALQSHFFVKFFLKFCVFLPKFHGFYYILPRFCYILTKFRRNFTGICQIQFVRKFLLPFSLTSDYLVIVITRQRENERYTLEKISNF